MPPISCSVNYLAIFFQTLWHLFLLLSLNCRYSSAALHLLSECCGWWGTWRSFYCPLAQQQRASFHFSHGSLLAAAPRQLWATERMLPGRYRNTFWSAPYLKCLLIWIRKNTVKARLKVRLFFLCCVMLFSSILISRIYVRRYDFSSRAWRWGELWWWRFLQQTKWPPRTWGCGASFGSSEAPSGRAVRGVEQRRGHVVQYPSHGRLSVSLACGLVGWIPAGHVQTSSGIPIVDMENVFIKQ